MSRVANSSEHAQKPFISQAEPSSTRAGMLRFLGEAIDTGWGDVFRRGAAPSEDRGRYPALADIERVRADVHARLRLRLAATPDEALQRPATQTRLPGVETLVDAIAFLAMHDAYHAGQLGYIRRSLGYPGVAG